jgi:uncharacterized 2Fe-2S/4Fe-4S cluster protein (DUF4445 family)
VASRFPVKLVPLGAELEAEPGQPLETLLLPLGVEFPCGGAGSCRGCRIRLIEGSLDITPEMREAFTPAELAAGWRLACCSHIEGPLTLEVAQWEIPVLADDSAVPFEPADGVGIAIDLGTTTVVVQAVDLGTGEVLCVRTALNPQAAHGADIMSRIAFAISGGAKELCSSIRDALGALICQMPRRNEVRTVMLAGNTVMHNLFCGVDVTALASVPFHPADDSEQVFDSAALGWDLPSGARVHFLPCLGGFVGSDLLAGIIATGLGEGPALSALIDLGTNGEVVLGNRSRILCASTAAGPAFEAGRIRMGMRASSGAISHVSWQKGQFECQTIGGAAPRGICGSGLVDAVAAGLQSEAILPSGRLTAAARELPLAGPVALTQSDVRQLQLAKGAIAAGLRILAGRWGAAESDIRTVYLAGAFGNYVRIASARRIGLLEVESSRVVPAGNTALRGVRMALLCPSRRETWFEDIRARTEHVPLASDPHFEEVFLDCLALGPSTADETIRPLSRK